MSAEKNNPPISGESQGFLRTYYRKALLAGAATLALAGGVYTANYLQKSGEYTLSQPAEPQPENIDQYHNFASWNMHNEVGPRLDEIDSLTRDHKVDVLALQEVNTDDAGLLAERFPEWYVGYVLADTKQEIRSGGYGNVLMTRQKPKDIRALSIEGDSLTKTVTSTVASATVDLTELDTSFENSRQAMRENRAALAMTIQAYDGNQLKNIRVITAHIGGQHDVNAGQLEQIIEFVKDNTKQGQATIMFGDLNASQERVILPFSRIGFVVPETTNTLVGKDRAVDYGAYYDAGVIGLGKISVLKNYRTDHYALLGRWTLENKD